MRTLRLLLAAAVLGAVFGPEPGRAAAPIVPDPAAWNGAGASVGPGAVNPLGPTLTPGSPGAAPSGGNLLQSRSQSRLGRRKPTLLPASSLEREEEPLPPSRSREGAGGRDVDESKTLFPASSATPLPPAPSHKWEGGVGQSARKIRSRFKGLDAFFHTAGRTALPLSFPDPFGRDMGWEATPAAPPEAPESIEQADLSIPEGARYTPSPEDWRDQTFYAVIVDRFARSGPHTTWGDPADGRTRHGGNLRGLIDKLDYLKGLGVTAVLVNPIQMNPPPGYHGYWDVNFLAVDPQIGTLADFQELVDKAHQRGMRIVLDMVFNHPGPVLEYEGGFKFGPRKPVKKWNYPLKPVELAKEEHFSRRGDINDWNDPEQIRHGDLPGGINHFDTENPATQDILLKIAKWWIQQTDVDGYRLDVYKHVAPAFWDRFFAEVRDYAGKLGKKDFFLVGELYDGDPRKIAPEVGIGRLGSAYNYPAYYADQGALHGMAPTRELEDNFHALRAALGDSLKYLVRFLDNHDRPHFLRPQDPAGLLRTALAFTLLTVGIPYLYYGDEQAFRQMPEHEHLDLESSREDMFAEGRFRNVSAPGDAFDTRAPMYKLVRALAGLRKELPALRRGEQYMRWSDPNGPGILAFSRIYGDQEVVVVLNNSSETRSAEMRVDAGLSPAGAVLTDRMDKGYSVAVRAPPEGGGSRIQVDVPAYGVRVLVRRR